MIALNRPCALLGGLSPNRFLREVWQKDYRLIRQAIAGFQGVVTPKEVLALATRDEVPSRLVIREGRRWIVEHGPFSARALKDLPPTRWTILVQDLNTVVPEADALLRRFAFLPYARTDDVMVSLAAPGGGVGPHFDSYDVFLLQGQGRRRWRIGLQEDLRLREDVPLKILKQFRPSHDWVLHPGDMLYLPPRYAHEGVALETCLTFSIGFRAPSATDVWAAALEHVLDSVTGDEPRLAETTLKATATPARLPSAYVRMFQTALRKRMWDAQTVTRIAGVFASTPKPHIVFDPPPVPMSRPAFSNALRSGKRTLVLDPKTILLWNADTLFVNGESVGSSSTVLRRLADRRHLDVCTNLAPDELDLIYSWYRAGWIKLI